MANQAKNPLYVVSKKKNTVEEAKNFCDAMIKKIGLAPFVKALLKLWEVFANHVQSYAVIHHLAQFIEGLLNDLAQIAVAKKA